MEWLPFTLAWDDAPLDLSFIYADERPAGKRGFLTSQGQRFVFEDGTEARFWGTCFNGAANFPTHVESDAIARRLAKFGVNLVRLHQMDAEWSTPNLFHSNPAQPRNDTRHFDPISLDRLDYMLAALKREGIYIYLDLLTYRQFLPGDEVDSVDGLGQAAKPYTYFDPQLIALQQEFNEQIWNHINPYTGLAYKDEPAIVLTQLKNESDLFTTPPILEPYRSRLEARYRAWATEHNLILAAEPIDFTRVDPQLAQFLSQVQQECYQYLSSHLREIGVRVPITGTNWSRTLALLESQLVTDFTDTHWYWNFPRWEEEIGTSTTPMVQAIDTVYATGSFMRTLSRPFFVSEWDHAWPDEWRAESSLLNAAIAAFQGWSGMAIHTYRYRTDGPVDALGGGTSTINGITYRNHFDSFNDPAKFGLFYQAALLFRRGDVQAATRSLAITIDPTDPTWRLRKPLDVPALRLSSEQHMVGMQLPGDAATSAESVNADSEIVATDTGGVRSDTGELWRSWKQGIGTIDTPRTKIVYGFLGAAGALTLNDLVITVRTSFAVIAISSLTNDPIQHSATLLLTAVGRSDNTGARYDEQHRRQFDRGHGPILIEPIEADIAITTELPNLKVWVVSDKGSLVTRLPTRYENQTFSFTIGAQPAWNPSTIYYLIRI